MSLRIFDPLNQYGGQSPVSVLARTGDVDNEATDHIKNVLEHGGMPMGLLSSKLKLDDGKVADIRRRWRDRYGGLANWLEPAVVDSDATFQKLGFSFEELGFETLDARNEARICMVLRVPPILVGAKIGLDRSTYSNYAEARKAFWQETLIPQYKRVRDSLQTALGDLWGDVELRWDFSEVVALQEDAAALRSFALQTLQAGAITVSEFRKMLGGLIDEPELDPRIGDVLYVPSGVTVTPIDPALLDERDARAEETQQAIANAAPKPDAEQEQGGAAPVNGGQSTAEDAAQSGTKASERVTPEGSNRLLPPMPEFVDISEADAIRAAELWDRLMPEYAGLLEAVTKNAD